MQTIRKERIGRIGLRFSNGRIARRSLATAGKSRLRLGSLRRSRRGVHRRTPKNHRKLAAISASAVLARPHRAILARDLAERGSSGVSTVAGAVARTNATGRDTERA